MLVGMLLLYFKSEPASLQFNEVLQIGNLENLAGQMVTIPLLGITVPWLALIAVLIFFGTVGKSAQFPLHVWLPDAMEGPTPVSAMIHAATMVSAGVYAMVRMFPLLSAGWHAGDPLTPPDPFEAIKALWGSMGFAMPGMVMPSFDSTELDKRIADLKAVEGWLQMNLGMLQTTIQGLEMQRSTLAAMQAAMPTSPQPEQDKE